MIEYVIDGAPQEAMTLPRSRQPALISRLKIMADMPLAERKIALSGSIPTRFDGHDYKIRTTSEPSELGEKLVLRIGEPELAAAI